MAKIDRYNGNLEAPASAALGTERTIFGTGSQSDDLTDQFNAFLLRGWGIVGPSDHPTLQDFNAMGFTLGQIHAYLHQMGVAEYNATQEYHTGSIANVAGVLYVSLIDTNVGNPPASSPAQWSPQSDHGMIVFNSPGVTAWTVPLAMQLGIIKPKVTVIGGGGGGAVSSVAGIANQPNGGSGGGVSRLVVDLLGVPSVTVTVGAGGAAGVADPGAGSAGGSSSFGAFCSATGGGGGSLGGTLNAAGVGSGGDVNESIGLGSFAVRDSANLGFLGGYGGGGSSPMATAAGSPSRPGHGGGGRISVPGAVAGAAGIVIIEW